MEEKYLAIIRASIASRCILKKTLAKRCGVSKTYFSEFIHGDRLMPAAVRDRLIRELELEDAFARIDEQASSEGA
jgi:hypothetical protein